MNKFITISCSGISIALPVRKDVNTPFLVIGAEGSGPESDTAFLSLSLRSTDFFSKLSSEKKAQIAQNLNYFNHITLFFSNININQFILFVFN